MREAYGGDGVSSKWKRVSMGTRMFASLRSCVQGLRSCLPACLPACWPACLRAGCLLPLLVELPAVRCLLLGDC